MREFSLTGTSLADREKKKKNRKKIEAAKIIPHGINGNLSLAFSSSTKEPLEWDMVYHERALLLPSGTYGRSKG